MLSRPFVRVCTELLTFIFSFKKGRSVITDFYSLQQIKLGQPRQRIRTAGRELGQRLGHAQTREDQLLCSLFFALGLNARATEGSLPQNRC
jgi:hypothetical protein